mmetsp:Transcript_718/g.2800  ORF Transcript_718/g.2800 Transcript_718/m.2800 type:complete len:215 (+) Transcript_718:438-1082(+)
MTNAWARRSAAAGVPRSPSAPTGPASPSAAMTVACAHSAGPSCVSARWPLAVGTRTQSTRSRFRQMARRSPRLRRMARVSCGAWAVAPTPSLLTCARSCTEGKARSAALRTPTVLCTRVSTSVARGLSQSGCTTWPTRRSYASPPGAACSGTRLRPSPPVAARLPQSRLGARRVTSASLEARVVAFRSRPPTGARTASSSPRWLYIRPRAPCLR